MLMESLRPSVPEADLDTPLTAVPCVLFLSHRIHHNGLLLIETQLTNDPSVDMFPLPASLAACMRLHRVENAVLRSSLSRWEPRQPTLQCNIIQVR